MLWQHSDSPSNQSLYTFLAKQKNNPTKLYMCCKALPTVNLINIMFKLQNVFLYVYGALHQHSLLATAIMHAILLSDIAPTIHHDEKAVI